MPELDPRLHAYRADLAAESLRGEVDVPRYSRGCPAQVVRGVADLRRAPGPEARLDTQLLSGEAVMVYDEADGWAWVQNQTDGYVGYVERVALGEPGPPTSHRVAVPRTFLFPEPDLKAPPIGALSMTGEVAVAGTEGAYSEVRLGAGVRGWVYSRHLAVESEIAPDHVETALQFLNVPYLWGGKSGLGLDCSGLVQVALHRAGIACPRDTDMQEAGPGEPVAGAPGAIRPERGDLVFFPGHVAIALDAARVVSANAHAMLVSIEPLAELEARVRAESGGTGVTGARRLARARARAGAA